MAVSVKAYYGEAGQGEIRRFVIDSPPSFAQLRQKIDVASNGFSRLFWIGENDMLRMVGVYSFTHDRSVFLSLFFFVDGDKDLVSLAGDDDLKVAASAVEAGQPLRVVVRGKGSGKSVLCFLFLIMIKVLEFEEF